MADPNSQRLAAATTDVPATQHQAAVTAPQSHGGALGFFCGGGAEAGRDHGCAVVPAGRSRVRGGASGGRKRGGSRVPARPSRVLGGASAAWARATARCSGYGAAAGRNHDGSATAAFRACDGAYLPATYAPMGMMMASMPQQAQAQATVANQPAQGMAPSQSLPMCHPSMMEMQQAQAGHMTAPPPLPLGPLPLMMQQQQQQPSQADTVIMAQPPLPLGPPPVMLQQQPPQGATTMMAQPPLPFSPPSVMLQHNPQGNQVMMAQPQFAALPCKRQRLDQYDNTYEQHMTGHQQETAIMNAAMGQSYGPNLHNGFPCFGAPEPSLPPDTTSTIYVEGLPTNCTRREVAHIFRQYMGFLEMRLVNKASNRHLCFVDFATPAQAFLAMRSLQGYRFDEQDPHSRYLNLQFSHSPRMGSHGGS